MRNLFISILLISVFSCSGDNGQDMSPEIPSNGIKIGDQIWMKDNLNVKSFRNGDPITESKTTEEWIRLYTEKKPAFTSYLWESQNEVNFGLIYNYYALSDPRGLTPENWRVPTSTDFFRLLEFNGGGNIGAKKIMSDKFYNQNPGNNESGFDARPGGEIWAGGTFGGLGNDITYWTTSFSQNGNLILIFINSERQQNFIFSDQNDLQSVLGNKGGFYVRGIIE